MAESLRPKNLAEALKMRRESGAVPFMGGTDLMVRFRSPAGALPQFPWPVLYLGHLPELRQIEVQGDLLSIGAGVSLTEIESETLVPELLRRAAAEMAAPALRNIGTLSGNVCNASPAGDALCTLYALGASVELTSEEGSRLLPVEEFITGPGRSDLHNDEILTRIEIPLQTWTLVSWRKVGTRRANALSKLSFSGLALIRSGRITEVRTAFGAVGPTVVRSKASEVRLAGASAAELASLRTEIMRDFDALIQPIDDQRSTAAYRKQVAMNLLGQFLDDLDKELS